MPEPQATEWECYTDLASEQRGLLRREAPCAPDPEGIETRIRQRRNLKTTWIHVRSEQGSLALRKPMGTYVTLELEPAAFAGWKEKARLVQTLAGELAELMHLSPAEAVLAVGLGNRGVVYDALGPQTVEGLWITRHLQGRTPESLGPIRPVSALAPGVQGQTGMETGEILRAIAAREKPAAVLVVDALAARNRASLGRCIQLTDTGLAPGSAILSGRAALTRESLGVPVYALGVPTVSTLEAAPDYVVTHREIARQIAFFAEILSRAVNLALHPQLTEEQSSQFVE